MRAKIDEMEANIKELKAEYVSLLEKFEREETDKQVGVFVNIYFVLLSPCLSDYELPNNEGCNKIL